MSTDTINDPIINDTARSIRRAKPKLFFIITEGSSYNNILTAKEFKALKPRQPDLSDAGVGMYETITPAIIAKLTEAMENPLYFENANDSFARKDVEKAKQVTGITFQYAARTAVLLSTGLFAIGCQTHPLSVWANTEPAEFGETQIARYLYGNADARDALIPVLKSKLKELRAA